MDKEWAEAGPLQARVFHTTPSKTVISTIQSGETASQVA